MGVCRVWPLLVAVAVSALMMPMEMVGAAAETSSSFTKTQRERSGVATFYTNYSQIAYCHGVGLPRDGLFAAATKGTLFKKGAACGKRVSVRCVGKGCISNATAAAARQPPAAASAKIVPHNNTGGPIVLTIVDFCSYSCKRSSRSSSDFALSLTAFAQLADPDLGFIHIRYKWA